MPVLLRCNSSSVYPAVTQFCLIPKSDSQIITADVIILGALNLQVIEFGSKGG